MPGALTFAAAEVSRLPAEDPSELVVVGAADAGVDGAVGLMLALAMVNGMRAVHPMRLVSLGVPTEVLRARLSKQPPRPPRRWSVDGFASSAWRETSTRTPIHFKVGDLLWERARFEVTLSAGDHHCHLELELNLDQQRFQLRPASMDDLLAVLPDAE